MAVGWFIPALVLWLVIAVLIVAGSCSRAPGGASRNWPKPVHHAVAILTFIHCPVAIVIMDRFITVPGAVGRGIYRDC